MIGLLLTVLTSSLPLADNPAEQAKVETFLSKPFPVFRQDRVPRGFRIIALSQLAEYCGRRGHTRCLKKSVEIARDTRISPYGSTDVATAKLGDHGLYLAHLMVIMTEARTRLGDKTLDTALHRVAKHLAARTKRAPRHHIASYAGDDARYPADQAVVLYALHRYDRLFGTDLAPPLINRWLGFMAVDGATIDGLHRSEVGGAKPWGRLARGCAMSWTIRYMAAFAPKRARTLWDRFVKKYEVSAWLLAGLREWPPGVDRPADLDSGPIVMGVGVAATAFAVGASRAVGDDERHRRLVRTMEAVYQAGGPEVKRHGRTILALSIALNGKR